MSGGGDGSNSYGGDQGSIGYGGGGTPVYDSGGSNRGGYDNSGGNDGGYSGGNSGDKEPKIVVVQLHSMPEPMSEQMATPTNFPEACFTVVNICESKSMMGGQGSGHAMMVGY